MKNILRSAITAISLTTLSTGAASAATMTADYSKGDGREISITTSSQGAFNGVYAGSFILDPVDGGDDIVSFCVDIAHYIADGVTYQIGTLASSGFSATVQSNIKRLFSSFYGTLGGDATDTSAFQVALWEIIDETAGNPLSLTSGQFRVAGSDVQTRAQQMLDNLGVANDKWKLTFYNANGYQDQLGAQINPVPVPAGLPLLLTAMGGFALARRLRKKA